MLKKKSFYWQHEIHIKKCYTYMFITHFISLLKYFSQASVEPQPKPTHHISNSGKCTVDSAQKQLQATLPRL